MATMTSTISKKLQVNAAALTLAAGTLTAVAVPTISNAAPSLPTLPAAPELSSASVLTWGADELPAGLVVVPTPRPTNDGAAQPIAPAAVTPVAPAAATPGIPGGNAVGSANAVGATPGELIGYLVQGIADGINEIGQAVQSIVRAGVDIVGTTVYVAVAFTGGVITAVGNFLPGPIGNVITQVGNVVNNVSNAIAEALRVGPYATAG